MSITWCPKKVTTVHDEVRDPYNLRLPHEQLHAALSRAEQGRIVVYSSQYIALADRLPKLYLLQTCPALAAPIIYRRPPDCEAPNGEAVLLRQQPSPSTQPAVLFSGNFLPEPSVCRSISVSCSSTCTCMDACRLMASKCTF